MRPVALMVLAMLLVGCADGTTLQPTTRTSGGSNPPAASGKTELATPHPATFSPITLRGKGNKVAKIKIPEGAPAIATATHSGSKKFAVTSIGADGSRNSLLVNTIGKYKGTVLFNVGAAEHSVAFQIEADGSWVIIIKPVASARSWNSASALKDTGDDVVRISPASKGLVTLDLTFNGQGNFAVESYADDGSAVLANEIDTFSGRVVLPTGSFLLSVTADGGTWSMTPR
jgi:hypothetical protein